MYICDQITGKRCLIDTGSRVTVIPKGKHSKLDPDPPYLITGVDGKLINTYGSERNRINLQGHQFDWQFIVADVPDCILGMDFIRHYKFIIDPHHNRISNKLCTIQCHSDDSPAKCLNIEVIDPVLKLIESFPEILRPNLDQPKHDIVHYIDTGDAPPIKAAARHYNPTILNIIQRTFEELLKLGYVRPSSSEWSSPLAVVKKANNEWRVCGDFRLLNLLTKNDNYILPLISTFNSRMNGCQYFSKIDLRHAFHQIPIYPPHICKTAVATPCGLYEYTRMPFGLKTSSQCFQRFADIVFRDCYPFSSQFIDDCVVFSHSKEEHLEHLSKIFQQLSHYNLHLNIKKSEFCKRQITFLGFDVAADGIRPSRDKVKAISNLPLPRTVGKVKSYLGMINFYCHSELRNHSKTTQHLPIETKGRQCNQDRTERRAANSIRRTPKPIRKSDTSGSSETRCSTRCPFRRIGLCDRCIVVSADRW